MGTSSFTPFKRKLVAGILLVSSVVCGSVGGVMYNSTQHFLQTASHADGTITAMIERRGDHTDSGPSYAPEFSFRDANGSQHVIRSNTSSNPPRYSVGDKVQVLYSPQNPDNARLNDYLSLWFAPTMFGGMAVIYLPIALLLLLWPKISARFKSSPPLTP